jgi:hypothetical protein
MFKGHIIVTHRGFDSTTDFVQVYSFAHILNFCRPFCEFNWDNPIDVAETVGRSDIRSDDGIRSLCGSPCAVSLGKGAKSALQTDIGRGLDNAGWITTVLRQVTS